MDSEPANRNATKASLPVPDAPIPSAYSELASQIGYLGEVIDTLAIKLEPVRNIYPALKDPGTDADEPPKSDHRRVIDMATNRVRDLRIKLESITTELEI